MPEKNDRENNNPKNWAAIAAIIIKSMKSETLAKFLEKIQKYREEGGDPTDKNVKWAGEVDGNNSSKNFIPMKDKPSGQS